MKPMGKSVNTRKTVARASKDMKDLTKTGGVSPPIRLVSFRCVRTKDWEQRMNRAIIMLLGTESAREGKIIENSNGRTNNEQGSIHDGTIKLCGEQGLQP